MFEQDTGERAMVRRRWPEIKRGSNSLEQESYTRRIARQLDAIPACSVDYSTLYSDTSDYTSIFLLIVMVCITPSTIGPTCVNFLP